jgi:hypothetical protein
MRKIFIRYDEDDGPTGMSPVRGLSIRNSGRDDEDSECGGSEDDDLGHTLLI